MRGTRGESGHQVAKAGHQVAKASRTPREVDCRQRVAARKKKASNVRRRRASQHRTLWKKNHSQRSTGTWQGKRGERANSHTLLSDLRDCDRQRMAGIDAFSETRKKWECDTQDSRVFSDLSTSWACTCLTSQSGRDMVFSGKYGRTQSTAEYAPSRAQVFFWTTISNATREIGAPRVLWRNQITYFQLTLKKLQFLYFIGTRSFLGASLLNF